jgi:hypothetical protein
MLRAFNTTLLTYIVGSLRTHFSRKFTKNRRCEACYLEDIKNAPKLELPSVRNQEETFRRMIFYSTIVV